MSRTATLERKRPGSRAALVVAAIAVLGILLAVIVASPGMRPSSPPAAAAPAAPALLGAREAQFDFGPVSMAAGKVRHRYWVRNESGAPLRIERIFTSCMCTTASFVKGARQVGTYGMPGHGPLPPVNETLAPEEAAFLDVTFDPAAHGPAGLGRTARVVSIEHGGGRRLDLRFTADVRP